MEQPNKYSIIAININFVTQKHGQVVATELSRAQLQFLITDSGLCCPYYGMFDRKVSYKNRSSKLPLFQAFKFLKTRYISALGAHCSLCPYTCTVIKMRSLLLGQISLSYVYQCFTAVFDTRLLANSNHNKCTLVGFICGCKHICWSFIQARKYDYLIFLLLIHKVLCDVTLKIVVSTIHKKSHFWDFATHYLLLCG